MYSIDRKVKSLFSSMFIDKFMFDRVDEEQLLHEALYKNLFGIANEIGPEVRDLVIRIYPGVPAGQQNMRFDVVAIPDEYARLIKRIDELENELRYTKNSIDTYAPVYDLLAHANARVDKEKDV